MRGVAVLSGGMDSTTAMALAIEGDVNITLAVSVDYGQRHRIELEQASEIADYYGVSHEIVDLTSINILVKDSVLTDHDREVPEGYYTDDNMKQTVVPNRNMIMASVAIGAVVTEEANVLVMGQHAGDHAVYPDCRPEFINHLELTAKVANDGFIDPDFQIYTPFINKMKWDIVERGLEIGVPYELTHTCYNGVRPACGRCATCVERLEAFWVATEEEFQDPIEYVDEEYWKEVSDEYNRDATI